MLRCRTSFFLRRFGANFEYFEFDRAFDITSTNETYIYIYIHPVSSIFRQRSFRWNIDGKQAGLKQSFKQFDSLRNRNRLRSIRTLLNKRFLKVFFEKLIFNDLEAWINIWKISLSELKYVLWNAWNISKLY